MRGRAWIPSARAFLIGTYPFDCWRSKSRAIFLKTRSCAYIESRHKETLRIIQEQHKRGDGHSHAQDRHMISSVKIIKAAWSPSSLVNALFSRLLARKKLSAYLEQHNFDTERYDFLVVIRSGQGQQLDMRLSMTSENCAAGHSGRTSQDRALCCSADRHRLLVAGGGRHVSTSTPLIHPSNAPSSRRASLPIW